MKETLTTGDIAKYCNVNLRTVIRWINAGKLKGYKLPGRGNNRVQVEDFLAFLDAHGMPVPEELKPEGAPLVLIVDDELQYARAIQRVIRQTGLRSEIATSGFHAGVMLNSTKPALMTLDLSMPGMDGFEVLKFVRRHAAFDNVQILVISALGESALQKALEAGANRVLAKPFENRELSQTVQAMLEVT